MQAGMGVELRGDASLKSLGFVRCWMERGVIFEFLFVRGTKWVRERPKRFGFGEQAAAVERRRFMCAAAADAGVGR